jgi:hypothetical protein
MNIISPVHKSGVSKSLSICLAKGLNSNEKLL